jgi:hypothetical protein
MLEKYREDYAGEHILVKTTFQGGKKTEQREWMENPITNQHISGRAAVISSNVDYSQFNLKHLQNHRGGLLGTKRLQTYGAGNSNEYLNVDFYVSTDREKINNLKEYAKDNIVYSSTSVCLNNPGSFYIIPYQPGLDDQSHAVYLAAFDGHQEIFLLGYNNDTPVANSNWQHNVNRIMHTYKNVTFYVVGVEINIPELWRKNVNVKTMTYRDFICYCDV